MLGGELGRTILVDDQGRNKVEEQNFVFCRKWEYGENGDMELLRVAAVVVFCNLVGPQAALALLRDALAAPPTARLR